MAHTNYNTIIQWMKQPGNRKGPFGLHVNGHLREESHNDGNISFTTKV